MYFLRDQTWGNCFLVSACLTFRYQMQRDLPQFPCGTPDASQLARRTMSDLELYNLVHEKVGRSSSETLKELVGRLDDNRALIHVEFSLREGARADTDTTNRLKDAGIGLVNGFEVNPEFEKRGLTPNTEPGIWVFEGDARAPGWFMKLREPVKSESEKNEKLKTLWSKQPQNPIELNATSPLIDTEGGPANYPTHEGGIFISATNPPTKDFVVGKLPDLTPNIRVPVAGPRQLERHSMVLLGRYTRTEGDKIFYLLQNRWEHMPLILVTRQYLEACRATISFLRDILGRTPSYVRNTQLVTSCSMPHSSEQWSPPLSIIDQKLCIGTPPIRPH